MDILAIANSKGGTGKTTTARQLAENLGINHRVLLIDLDPQASLTKSFAFDQEPSYSSTHVLSGEKRIDNAITNAHDNIDILTADARLSTVERALSESPSGQMKLRNALKVVANNYAYCIIDTIGATSMLVFNALAAANIVIVPTRPEGTDLETILPFIKSTVEDANDAHHGGKQQIAILPTQYVDQSTHHREAIEAFKTLGYKVLSPIGRSIKVSEAMFNKANLQDQDKRNPRTHEYELVTREVVEWLKK